MIPSKLLAAAGFLIGLGAYAASTANAANAADEAPAAPTLSPAASAVPVADGSRIVCAREMLVGSRIPTRVCRTVDPVQDEINRQQTRRLIHQGAPAAAQGINGKSGG